MKRTIYGVSYLLEPQGQYVHERTVYVPLPPDDCGSIHFRAEEGYFRRSGAEAYDTMLRNMREKHRNGSHRERSAIIRARIAQAQKQFAQQRAKFARFCEHYDGAESWRRAERIINDRWND